MMPQFATNRPDNNDREELKKFASKIKEMLNNNALPESVNVPGKIPYVKVSNMPLKIKVNKNCIKCDKCAKRCPVGAISYDNPSSTNNKKCITCMRCIEECPQKARFLPPILMTIISTAMKNKFKRKKDNILYIK